MSENKPPVPRHRITISMNVNSMDELSRTLRHIGQTTCLEDDAYLDRTLQIVGGGYSITSEHNPDMTPERYKEELMEWFDAKRQEQSDSV